VWPLQDMTMLQELAGESRKCGHSGMEVTKIILEKILRLSAFESQ
jgi:hypothetical protein